MKRFLFVRYGRWTAHKEYKAETEEDAKRQHDADDLSVQEQWGWEIRHSEEGNYFEGEINE